MAPVSRTVENIARRIQVIERIFNRIKRFSRLNQPTRHARTRDAGRAFDTLKYGIASKTVGRRVPIPV